MTNEAAFEKLTEVLRQSLQAPTLEETRTLIADALKRTERLSASVLTAATKRGRLGGKTTAKKMLERDPDYYKRIAAMRKTKGGGRPKKQDTV